MRIKAYTYRSRRDFKAVYECEHCGELREDWGYDDANFHQNVIPKMRCNACGKTAGTNYAPHTPRYPEGFQI